MELAFRLLGALVVTYVLSRLALKLVKGRIRMSAMVLIGVHLVSFAVVAIPLGLMRAYLTNFEWSAANIYIGPQIAWLLLDLARLRR